MNTCKKPMLEKAWVVCGLAVLCNALWGSAFPSIKIGYKLFEIPGDSPASQILFAGMRFALAAGYGIRQHSSEKGAGAKEKVMG